jgi:hypothetical protein
LGLKAFGSRYGCVEEKKEEKILSSTNGALHFDIEEKEFR